VKANATDGTAEVDRTAGEPDAAIASAAALKMKLAAVQGGIAVNSGKMDFRAGTLNAQRARTSKPAIPPANAVACTMGYRGLKDLLANAGISASLRYDKVTVTIN
jgi:hypothetical protein